jgi:hypothetical protein
MAAKNETSTAKARKLQHQIEALELRRAGLGYIAIGARLGLGKSQAHRLVVAALKEAREQVSANADDLRAEEVSRLDAMLVGLWNQARNGGVSAIDRVVKIMERRAKLLGLDAPVKMAHGGDPGAPPVQMVSMTPGEFSELAAMIAAKT